MSKLFMHRFVATLRPLFILFFILALGRVLYENFKPPDYDFAIVSPINSLGLSADMTISTEEFAIASELTPSLTPTPTQILTQIALPTIPFVLSTSVFVPQATPTATVKPTATKTPTPILKSFYTPSKTPTPSRTPTAKPSPTVKPSPTATPKSTSTPSPTITQSTSAIDPNSEAIWEQIAKCESNNNWSIDTGNGYYGGLQFSQSAWNSVGGSGNPAHASREEQIAKGKLLQQKRGWGVWGLCAINLGLN